MMQVDGWDLINPDDLQASEFELGGMQWRIKKLLPMEGYKVLKRYVFPMFNTAREMDVDGLTAPAIMMRVVGSADPDILDRLSEIFIRHCIYFRNDAGQFVKMATDVEYATKNLLPIELMILDVRSFCVNFGESVSKIVSEFQMRMEAVETDTAMDQNPPTLSSTPELQQASTPSRISKPGRKKATQK